MIKYRRGNAAFGLLALLIVVAIVLYMMFGASTGGSGGASSAGNGYVGEVKKARDQGVEIGFAINAQQLSILIAQYRQEHNGKLPQSPADLDSPGAFNDRWGKEMTFSFSGAQAESTAVTYRSAGPDGEMNTRDDVTSTGVLPF
jgi:hypothetical protein